MYTEKYYFLSLSSLYKLKVIHLKILKNIITKYSSTNTKQKQMGTADGIFSSGYDNLACRLNNSYSLYWFSQLKKQQFFVRKFKTKQMLILLVLLWK